jgi:hypothetical protein
VSPSGGDALLRVIQMMQDWVSSGDHGTLNQRPMLGGSYGARVMAPFVQQIASDQQGFLTQLTRLRGVLSDAEAGVKQAMANYRQNEHSVAGAFRG